MPYSSQPNYGKNQCLWLKSPLFEAEVALLNFNGSLEAFNQPGCWTAELILQDWLPDAHIGTPTALSVSDGVETQHFHGKLTRSELLDFDTVHYRYNYRLQIETPIATLQRCTHYRTFINKPLKTIITTVLAPIAERVNVNWNLSKPVPKPVFRFQYGEDSFHFLEALCADYGYYFYLQPGNDMPTLHILDDIKNTDDDPLEVTYAELTGHERPAVSAWQLETEETRLYPEGSKTTYRVKTDALTVYVGKLISLSRHVQDELNKTYRITHVTRHAQQQAADTDSQVTTGSALPYYSLLQLIDIDAPWPLELNRPHKVIHHTSAYIAGETDMPYLNEQGHYKLRFPLDEHQYAPAELLSVPMVQPIGGDGSGYHFPLTPGTAVMVGFLNDDINQPLILGSRPSVNSTSPVTEANATEHVIRTRAGHEMIFDDNPQSPSIKLASSQAQNHLTLTEAAENSKIELHSVGDIHLQSQQNIVKNSEDLHTLKSQSHHSTVQGQHTAVIDESLSLNAGKNLNLSSKGNMQLESTAGNIVLHSGDDADISSGKDLTLNSRKGDINFHSEQDIHLQTTKGLKIQNTDHSQPIQLQGPNKAIELKSGKATLRGKNITITAPQVYLQGEVAMNTGSGGSAGGVSGVEGFEIGVGSSLLDMYLGEVGSAVDLLSNLSDDSQNFMQKNTKKDNLPLSEKISLTQIPAAEVSVKSLKSVTTRTLYPQPYIMVLTTSISANLTISNKKYDVVEEYGNKEIKQELQDEVKKIFSDFEPKKSYTMFENSPSLNIENDYGGYSLGLELALETEDIKEFTGSLSKDISIADDLWHVSGHISIKMTILLKKKDLTDLEIEPVSSLDNEMLELGNGLSRMEAQGGEVGDYRAAIIILGVVLVVAI
jgi:uncharacterized protein involved in type VI secretion and phage assembly